MMTSDPTTPSSSAPLSRFWGARLNPGVRSGHLLTFYVSAFAMILLAVAINALQPYLLSSFLNLHVTQHGDATGTVATVGELVLFALVGVWGAMSDRTGRRRIYVVGFTIVAVGFALTPFSDSVALLMTSRAVYAVGIAATTAMLSTILADYVINRDRGKANAIMGVANGLGAAMGALLLSRLPQLFQSLGQDRIAAGWSTYLSLAVLSLLVAFVLRIGLKPRGGERVGLGEHSVPLSQMMREGMTAARRDVGVALSYAAAFVARADLAIAGLFFPLWLTKHEYASLSQATRDLVESTACAATAIAGNPAVADACSRAGEAAAAGVKAGGLVVGAIGGGGLLFAPVIGILCDRINRVTALAIGLTFNVVGYGMTLLIDNPRGGIVWAVAAVIGCGQVGGVIASQVLVQQQAPANARGAVIGAFSTFGALGLIVCLFAGGKLFDGWREAGPFAMLSVLNFAVVAAAVALRHRIRAPQQAVDECADAATSEGAIAA